MEKKHETSHNPASAEVSKKRKSLNDLEKVEVEKKKGRRNLSLAGNCVVENQSSTFLKKTRKGKANPSPLETNTTPEVNKSMSGQVANQEDPLKKSSVENRKFVVKKGRKIQESKEKEVQTGMKSGESGNPGGSEKISSSKRGRVIAQVPSLNEGDICINNLPHIGMPQPEKSSNLLKSAPIKGGKRGRKSKIIVESNDVMTGNKSESNDVTDDKKSEEKDHKGRRKSLPIKLETSMKSKKNQATIFNQRQEEPSQLGNYYIVSFFRISIEI